MSTAITIARPARFLSYLHHENQLPIIDPEQAMLDDAIVRDRLEQQSHEIRTELARCPELVHWLRFSLEHKDDPNAQKTLVTMISQTTGVVGEEGVVSDVWTWLKNLCDKIVTWLRDFFRAFFGKAGTITKARVREHRAAQVRGQEPEVMVALAEAKIDNGYTYTDIKSLAQNTLQGIGYLSPDARITNDDLIKLFPTEGETTEANKVTPTQLPRLNPTIPNAMKGTHKLKDLGWVGATIYPFVDDMVTIMRSEMYRNLDREQQRIAGELTQTKRQIEALKMSTVPDVAVIQRTQAAIEELHTAGKNLAHLAHMSNLLLHWSDRLTKLINNIKPKKLTA